MVSWFKSSLSSSEVVDVSLIMMPVEVSFAVGTDEVVFSGMLIEVPFVMVSDKVAFTRDSVEVPLILTKSPMVTASDTVTEITFSGISDEVMFNVEEDDVVLASGASVKV